MSRPVRDRTLGDLGISGPFADRQGGGGVNPIVKRIDDMMGQPPPKPPITPPAVPGDSSQALSSATAGPGVSSSTATTGLYWPGHYDGGFTAGGIFGTLALSFSGAGFASAKVEASGQFFLTFDVQMGPSTTADGRAVYIAVPSNTWPIPTQTIKVTKYDATGAVTTAGTAQVQGTVSAMNFGAP